MASTSSSAPEFSTQLIAASSNLTENSTLTISNICEVSIPETTYQILIAVINLIHLLILAQLRKREPSLVLILLMAISVNDVSLVIFQLFRYLCLRQYLTSDDCLVEMLIICGVNLIYSRYYILASACYDRFVAICRPFRYDSNHYLKHVTVYLTAMYISSVLISWLLYFTCQRCWYFSGLLTDSAANKLCWLRRGFGVQSSLCQPWLYLYQLGYCFENFT